MKMAREKLINKIGEFGLIERLRKRIKLDPSVVVGSGDDCAALTFNKKEYQLFTCDMIVEGVDFRPWDDKTLVGRKALAVNISDIAACAGVPRYAVVSLGLPKKTNLGDFEKISQGMLNLAKEYKINIVGGDISRAKNLTIDVSLLGIVEKEKLVLRKGAKKGDIIFVSGSLGGSIRGKHLKFIPRLKEARFLVKNFKINSMIDISDGLCQDLNHILRQSKVGAIIYETLLPLNKDCSNLKDALYWGEDFELLFTVSQAQAMKILEKNIMHFVPIGEVIHRGYGLRMVDKRGGELKLKPCGYRHF